MSPIGVPKDLIGATAHAPAAGSPEWQARIATIGVPCHSLGFCEIKRGFQVGGVAALIEEKRGPRNPHPNRVAPEVEEKILAYALEQPSHY